MVMAVCDQSVLKAVAKTVGVDTAKILTWIWSEYNDAKDQLRLGISIKKQYPELRGKSLATADTSEYRKSVLKRDITNMEFYTNKALRPYLMLP